MRRLIIGILLIIGVLIFTYQGLVPLTQWFVESDLGDKIFYSELAENTDNKDRSALAFTQCKNYAKQQVESGSLTEFSSQDYKPWKVSTHTYIIQFFVEVQDPSNAELHNKYLCVCKLRYTGGDDTDQKNWALLGFELAEPSS